MDGANQEGLALKILAQKTADNPNNPNDPNDLNAHKVPNHQEREGEGELKSNAACLTLAEFESIYQQECNTNMSTT